MLNTIYSKVTKSHIPVRVEKQVYATDDIFPQLFEYNVYDKRKKIGFVRLHDTDKGCYVQFIKNERPDEYGDFGYFADKIEVQHCLNRGMRHFEVTSYADFNSHGMHYKRGKRFLGQANEKQIGKFQELFKGVNLESFNINEMVKYIVSHTPKGKSFNTWFLDQVSMYMPKKLIKKYVSELKSNPILIK